MFRLGAIVTLLALCRFTSGYPSYADRLPNGGNVAHPCKPNYLWKGVGHINALGGGERNQFGKDFLANGATWNKALCQMDSDGDGMTNGQELGDPQCVWTQNALPSRTSSITHPGVCDPWDDPQCQQNNTWVDCDVENFNCDVLQNDPDVRNVTLRFPPTPVPGTETNYYCMTFDLPGDDLYHLVATEPYIDNAQVMHHILVYGCQGDELPNLTEPTQCGMEAGKGCDNLIGLWQVGYAGSCVNPNAGFKFGRGAFTRIKMEFHWNNPELRTDYTDSSGMRFFYTPNLRQNSAGTMMIGQMAIEIPPLQPAVQITGSCSSQCTSHIVNQSIYVFDGTNHMHYLGKSQKVELLRNDVVVATLTNDEAYSYDAPVSHVLDPPVQVLPGDEIRTTCTFNSQYKQTTTYYGDGTSDEMCFAFLSFYPLEALSTRTCIGYNDRSYCGQREEPEERCDFSYFLNESIPEMQQFMAGVSTLCKPLGPCTPECDSLLELVKDEPCMKGRSLQGLKDYMAASNDFGGLLFLTQLLSCPKPDCPECPRCPTTTTTTTTTASNNNQRQNGNNDDTGDARAVAPGMVSVALLLLVSVLLI